MYKKLTLLLVVTLFLGSCVSVPLKTVKESNNAKQFNKPSNGKSGLYIYRNSFVGGALKKDIWIDGKCIGESAPDVFFYKEVLGNKEHTISTESEFSPNNLILTTKENQNYFIRQYIKFGLFVGGSGVELVNSDKGMKDISKLELAKNGNCSK